MLFRSEILSGKHLERPQGDGGNLFTDAIWDMVELCWRIVPSERANAKDVLKCLEECSTVDVASADLGGFSSFHPKVPVNHPCGMTETDPPIAPDENGPPVPPPRWGLGIGWIGVSLLLIAWSVFIGVTKKIHVF